MLEQRVAAEVRDASENLTPVAGIEESPRHVAPKIRHVSLGPKERCPDQDGNNHCEQGRKESSGSTDPEVPEINPTGLLLLTDQQRGDEVPRYDEEHLDAKEAAVHPRKATVVEQHSDHRQCTQAVKRGFVPHLAGRGNVSRGPPRHHEGRLRHQDEPPCHTDRTTE